MVDADLPPPFSVSYLIFTSWNLPTNYKNLAIPLILSVVLASHLVQKPPSAIMLLNLFYYYLTLFTRKKRNRF